MPLFKFLRPEIWRLKIFVSIGWKRLKYQNTQILDLRYQKCEWCKNNFTEEVQKSGLRWETMTARMSQSTKGRASGLLGKQVYASLGTRITYRQVVTIFQGIRRVTLSVISLVITARAFEWRSIPWLSALWQTWKRVMKLQRSNDITDYQLRDRHENGNMNRWCRYQLSALW